MLRPLVLGHRGASADAPENTLDAFALARAQGADGVELDVRRTVDGAMALVHDARLADGRLVVETRADDLPAGVPMLADALEECEGMLVNIEIKNVPVDPDHDPTCALADQVVDLLAARGGRDHVIVSCFGLATVDRVRALDASVPTALLTFLEPSAERGLDLVLAHGHAALHPFDAMVDAALVERAHAAGVAVNVWTVDGAERLVELAGFGVDAIVTNRPAFAIEVLGGSR